MKLHRNLIEAVVQGLFQIFNQNLYADKVVEKLLKKDKRWGARDRGFIAETIYEIVRWKRLYQEIANTYPPFSTEKIYRIFTVWATLRGFSLPDWLSEDTPSRRIKGRFDELSKIRKFRESVPDWLDTLAVLELGEDLWTKEIHALNTTAPVVIRTNTLKISKLELKKNLEKQGIETFEIPNYPDALQLNKRCNVFSLPAFKEGFFEVQDASSQCVAPYLDISPGMRVADCCAGAGGKTLHIASLMQNKGQIIATDIHQYKLDELKKRAKRNGIFNIETKIIDNKFLKRNKNTFDRVLIDAPCSGLGVLKRNPDTKWKLQPENLNKIRTTQQEILQKYCNLTKIGGNIVYATCSILPSENRKQIDFFLQSEEGKNFQLIKDDTLWASTFGYDGFYISLLKKVK